MFLHVSSTGSHWAIHAASEELTSKAILQKHSLASGFPSGSTRARLMWLGKDKVESMLEMGEDDTQIVWILFLTRLTLCQ